jgi:hypothetical protein
MIRIDKSRATIPSILAVNGKGMAEIQNLKNDYENGIRDFSFTSKIYGHKSVKEKLISIQNDKCCFCEARIGHISHGDLEHFRPKGGYKSGTQDRLTKPGYYWLAYDFSNLFLACEKCNRSYKPKFLPFGRRIN